MTAEFVRLAGRPGHEGLFPIQGQPVVNRPATLADKDVRVSRTRPDSHSSRLDGTVLRQLDLEKIDDDEFVGPIELPSQAFRVAAVGTDAAGLTYQRLYAALFRAASVELSISGPDELRAGSTTPVPIAVRNHGPAARFRIVVVYGQGVVGVVEPAFVDLAQGAEATVTASVKVPANASAGSIVRCNGHRRKRGHVSDDEQRRPPVHDRGVAALMNNRYRASAGKNARIANLARSAKNGSAEPSAVSRDST